jgi:ubiquinone/menaquinone biosynthesis C-methylase UbiE
MLKRFLAVSYLVLAAGAAAASSAQDSELGRNILDESGVKGGFVVHVGCGDGTLTAALGSGAAYLVHGLDEGAEKVKAAREHIKAQGLYGRVAVEQWSGVDLPYADNLVNLMVVSAGYQVSHEEIMRVLA